ncbi:MAG: transposase [Clostridium sp.]|nr:transposase [Clostridium sp.]
MKIDKEKITHICINDFAIRKRHAYGTVMINIKTRCIIDILNSRDTQDVANWLKEYPNLKVIVQDGSISFKAAIEASHPNAIQVNDRFHILKNLVETLKKVLQRLVIGRIEIPLTSTEAKQRYKYLTELTREEKIIKAKKLCKEGLSCEKIAKQLHVSTTTANKYVKIDMT